MKNALAKNVPKLSFSAVVGTVFLLSFGVASAATLSLSPSSATHAVGQTFTLSLVLSSADQATNAMAGTVSFPSDLLEVAALSKSSSVVSFWIQEPTYSNTAGTIDFSGVVPNPGFTGSFGTILNVTFRALKAGEATIAYGNDAQVLANDGNGTDILKSVSGATITIVEAPPPKAQPTAPPPPSPQPAAPEATSTYPATTVAPTALPEFSVDHAILGIPLSVFGWYAAFLEFLLLIVLLCILLSLYYRRPVNRSRHERLTRAHVVLHEQFSELRAAILEEIAALERIQSKRALTEEEERFVREFRKKLDAAKNAIAKEVDDALRE